MTLTTLYFGYGSNLWLEQMQNRCPDSIYIGVGRLPGFKWIINSRGYANIVPSDNGTHEVYGLVYKLTTADEATLDKNEGVPYAYTKEYMNAELWKLPKEVYQTPRSKWNKADITKPGQSTSMLVYIDRSRIQESKPKEEYVYRMNMGIVDAETMGVPASYVHKHMRPFIPPSASKDVESLANAQARSFSDDH